MGRLITGSDALTRDEVQALIAAQIAAGASDWPAITNKPTSLAGAGIVDVAHPWVMPPSGEWLVTTIGGSDTLATSARTANALEAFQFIPQSAVPVTQVAISVSTGAGLGRVLIYDADADGRMAGLLYQSADLDCSTSGVKTAPCALTLDRGRRYWLATWFSAAATMHVWPTSALPDINGGAVPSTFGRKLIRRTVAFASAAPASWVWTSSEISSARPAAIWLGV